MIWLAGAAALFIPSSAFAQSGDPAQAPDSGTRSGYHDEPSGEIIVTGVYQQNTADVLSGTTVLTGTKLTEELRPSIGETLARQPGVSASSFGPTASRPILRGFQGDRVRILNDGLGSFDVSSTSVDHAVAINPLIAKRIEVLRGPSSLQFGSSAIGGVVNVIDSRIPSAIPDEPVHIDALATYGSAANERTVAGAADSAIGKVVFHVDGSYTKSGDLDTGGYILSRDLRDQAALSDDPEIQRLANLKGKLPNSQARTWDVGGGASIVTDTGFLGVSVSHYDSLYGVPVRYALDPDTEAEEVSLAVKQTRAGIKAEFDTGGGIFSRIRWNTGYGDYKHSEIEDTGEVGTTFYNKSIESRLELVQTEHDGWKGAIGGQFLNRDFNVVGEEAFLPKNNTQQFGLFTVQSVDLGNVRLEGGARYERTNVSADPSETIGNPAYKRHFDAVSGSVGASYGLTDTLRIGLNASHSERAPTAEELFADGPHAGTQAFEVGNPDFAMERSNGIEATLKGTASAVNFSLSAYYDWFSNYIYEAQTGAVEDGLPVYQYYQGDARYYGFEAEASAKLAQIGATTINLDGLADYVHATITHEGPAPRIPPLRVMGGLEAQADRLQGRVEVEHVFEQDRITQFETPTDDYTMVNASLAFKPWGKASNTSLVLQANNLFDVTARRHTSFLKDYAPLAGRDLRATLRVAF